MKAVCWCGTHNVNVESVPDPKILNPRDAIIRISSTAICGSDLHLYNGVIPGMQAGDILGHEFMGEVVEVGSNNHALRVGDRVVVPFTIACGNCFSCQHKLWSACDNSNTNAWVAETMYGYTGAGLFGYSHVYGGYAGGQAEYVRVPYADSGPCKIPSHLRDDQVLFISDILSTAYMAAENANIQKGDTVAIWGAGPVGLLTIQCAYLLGAERVISIDHYTTRLKLAAKAKAEVINFDETNVLEALDDLTGGRGPDSCIDAVGLEAHGMTIGAIYDRIKMALYLATDRPNALREAIMACRKGGTLSIPGVYGGLLDKLPFGAAFAKGLTFRMGQTHVQNYMSRLLSHIEKEELDPTSIITHRLPLSEAANAYSMFNNAKDEWVKIVLKP